MKPETALSDVKRIAPIMLVVALHAAFFYALQSGLLRDAVRLVTKEVAVNFITPEEKKKPEPEPPKQQVQAPAKAAAAVKTPPARQETAAVVEAPPSPTAIEVPPAPPVEQAPAPVAQAAQAAPPAPPSIKTVSSGVEYLQQPRIVYPQQSRRFREEGKVMLRVLVSDAGRPQSVEVKDSSGSPRLDEAARQAVMGALFKPHQEDGKPVAVYVLVPVDFQLNT